MTTNNKIANRKTIAHQFQTDELTTHRILMNLNFGFFITHFGDDAKAMWKEAHPFLYPSGLQDYTSFSLNFLERYFNLFSQNHRIV